MRRLVLSVLCGLLLSTSVGCLVPAYSGDRTTRTRQMLFNSENFRQMLEEWDRIWFLNQPDHMTPYRTHGGII